MKKTAGMFYLLLAPLLITAFPSSAQMTPDNRGTETSFDFWIGTWALTWEDGDGSMASGTNFIERILDQKVIKEKFEALSGAMEGFKGESYTVYNSRTGIWKQTWVDSNGGYLDFSGEFDENRRFFIRKGVAPGGQEIHQRMVFYNIAEDSFTWDWEISTDDGATWQLRWRIFYDRVE
jgi:hypothetical protein